MANQYIGTKRTSQGALAAAGTTLIPAVAANGASVVHTVDELATAIGGYTVPAISQESVRSAKVMLVNTQNYTVPSAFAWATAEHDDGGWYSVGVPSRLTVLAGVTKVILCLSVAGGTGTLISIIKNGVIADKVASGMSDANINLFASPLEVIAGDYFEVYLETSAGGIIASALSYFSIMEVERAA